MPVIALSAFHSNITISFEHFSLHRIQIDQVILASITDFFSTIFLENVLGHNEIVLPQVDADFLKQIAAFTYTDTFGREHGETYNYFANLPSTIIDDVGICDDKNSWLLYIAHTTTI